jgi:succinate-semialdehyde dehydrogenase/glutarate-semialdehyde dehydrogenase
MTIDGRLIIDGRRVAGEGGLLTSKSPASLEAVGEAHLASSAQCRDAVAAAKAAFPGWRDTPAEERRRVLRAAGRVLLRRAEEAARLLSLEKGSPLTESLGTEVQGSLAVLDYYGRIEPPSLKRRPVKPHTALFASKKCAFHFQPLGPTLVISPWNFPLIIPFSDVISALAAGNTVVLRPSTSTPLAALLLGEVLLEAGLPAGALNVAVCRTPQAEEMILHPDIQTVMFTGSVGVGKRIMELGSRNLTNVILELGGKDPMIVLRDADLDRAARGAVWAAFMNCGQSCASVERVYVAHEIEAEFTARVVALARELKVGDPLEPGTDIGPMTTLSQLETVLGHIRDAREKGARVLVGGGRVDGKAGYFMAPTVLSGVDHRMDVMIEETFGPVLPIMAFTDEDEAVALANDCRYGLTASVWTRNRKSAARIAGRLEAGSVTINDHMFSFIEPKAIWGGIKQTGLGRSHGPYGLLNLVNIKFVSRDFRSGRENLWWFPYTPAKSTIIAGSLDLIYGRGPGRKARALFGLRSSLGFILKRVSPKSIGTIVRRFFR